MSIRLYIYMMSAFVLIAMQPFNCVANNRTHIKINENERVDKNEIILTSSTSDAYFINFKLNSYDLVWIESEKGYKVEANSMVDILDKGKPSLPRFTKSIMIPASADLKVEIISSEYIELEDIKIVPSKGDIERDIDPETIAYEYGETYQSNTFYPSKIANLKTPYILRSTRGQAIAIQPITYNPVSKKLRIYTSVALKISKTDKLSTKNVLSTTKSGKSEFAFEKIYESHFLNYSKSNTKYAAINDNPGNMLIICYDDFVNEMADFIAWKQQKGISVEMVPYSSIGSASAIKTYVQDYYNQKGLTYLLLVGDAPQVPTSSVNGNDSDNNYGYIVGDDHYLDILVGRFSAENIEEIKTQVERTIHYERDVSESDTWFSSGVGIASNMGANPSDEEHMNAIENSLTGYGYTMSRCYQDGGSAEQLTRSINRGVGVINYAGHGYKNGFTSMTYTCNDVKRLSNENKLPFIFDVSCLNGNFKNSTCFAETWLRSTKNGEPIGAIAICAPTSNQSWVPTMIAQNEMNDILVESYENNIRRTFSGIAINGMFKMVEMYEAIGERMIDTWTIFGDPSLQVRTKTPSRLEVSHSVSISPNSNTFVVTSTIDDAWVSMTIDNEIIGTAKIEEGSAVVNFDNLPEQGSIKLTVTAYNKIPYIANIVIENNLFSNFSANKTNINEGESITFTDLSSDNASSSYWQFPGGTPEVSTSKNPTITYYSEGSYSVSLTTSNSNQSRTKTASEIITVSTSLSEEYCEAETSGNSSFEYISNVSFENLNNNTTYNTYTDYTSQIATVVKGETYDISVNIGRPTSGNYISVWFDWNRDGNFFGTDEEYVLDYDYSNAIGKAEGQIEIPESAILGQTRMRVRLTHNSIPEPCGYTTYGEIEDYSLMLQSEDNQLNADNDSPTIRIYPNPAADYFKIEQVGSYEEIFVKIINMAGNVINTFNANAGEMIDVSNLKSGIYIVKMNSGGKITSQKLVIT